MEKKKKKETEGTTLSFLWFLYKIKLIFKPLARHCRSKMSGPKTFTLTAIFVEESGTLCPFGTTYVVPFVCPGPKAFIWCNGSMYDASIICQPG